MIDIKKAKEELINYINNVEIENSRIQTKKEHILRVAELSRKIAVNLELSQEQIELAELIGLLHDIGRFEQYQKFNKNTKSKILDDNKIFDHGEVGVEILKKDNYIRKYIQENTYDNIIYTAIYEHNKYEVTKQLSQEEKLFCNIVRDADKIDIIYEAVYKYWQEPEQITQIENGKLSKKMLQDFYLQKLSNNSNRISQTDQILRFASFIFDINFKCSFEILKENDNVNKMLDRFKYKIPETKEEMNKIKEIANKYIDEKTK